MGISEIIERVLAEAQPPRRPVHPFRKQVIVCPTDMADRIRELIAAQGWAEMYEVLGSAHVPNGKAYLMPKQDPTEFLSPFRAGYY